MNVKIASIVKSKAFKIVIIISISLCVIITPILLFLDSIHYKFIDYLFDQYFNVGLDPVSGFTDFKENKDKFEIIVQEIDYFIDENPQYGKSTIEFDVQPSGLLLHVNGSELFHSVDNVNWYKALTFTDGLPKDFGSDDILYDPKYPDCIIFRAEQEVSSRKLVYTESGFKPKNLIDDYWEKFNFVHVDRLAWGWYDIYGI